MIKRQGGWFRPRSYSHFDYPPTYDQASKLACQPAAVAKHSFLPLISFTDVKRQFRTDNSDLTLPRKLRPRIVKTKTRDLRYASHRDSAIYAYYAFMLQSRYEAVLRRDSIDDCVIGYRSGLGSNIDLAASAFAEIALRGTVTALCFDIENFFPSIRHDVLKAALLEVLDVAELSDDWFAVWKNVCRYSHIELKSLAELDGFDPEDPPFPLVQAIPEAMRRCRNAGLVERNNQSTNVPQGTPISAVFANVSMLTFDRAVEAWATSHGGSYRRYSDDIMLLVAPDLELSAKAFVQQQAAGIALTINREKTDVSRFEASNWGIQVDHPVTYLGFTFDGDKVALRARTLSRYYRRMTYATRGAVRHAGKLGQKAENTFKRTLLRDFSHLGRRNFYSYAKKADGKFANSIVKRQLRRHFVILLRKLKNRGR